MNTNNFILLIIGLFISTSIDAQETLNTARYPQIEFNARTRVQNDGGTRYDKYIGNIVYVISSTNAVYPMSDRQHWDTLRDLYDYERECIIGFKTDSTNNTVHSIAVFCNFGTEIANFGKDDICFHDKVKTFDAGFATRYLEEITLPGYDCLKFIESPAAECDNLYFVDFYYSDKSKTPWLIDDKGTLYLTALAFHEYASLLSVPDSVSRIGAGAMRRSKYAPQPFFKRTLIIPSSVKSIGENALENCGFQTILINGEDVTIHPKAFGEYLGPDRLILANNKLLKKLKKSHPHLKQNLTAISSKKLKELGLK